MKQWKRLTALLLGAACLCALITVPPASASATPAVSTFPDVTDPQVGRAVEALRMMGVINGDGGNYNPQNNLTRAQFCKMAIVLMGRKDEADAQANRTIFTDVPGSHWARGYVNLAATTNVGDSEDGKGGSRLMMGLGDGTFAPDRAITYGEAVTILLRILGYTRQANANWPQGAVSAAASIGLTNGFTPPKAGEPITRAQAAVLFCNMLTAPVSGTKDTTYLDSLNCKLEEGTLLLNCDATAPNGQSGAVQLFADKGTHNAAPVLSAIHSPADFLQGTRGTAVFNDKGLFLTFLPDTASTSKVITVASATLGSACTITGIDGSEISLTRSTKVLGEEEPTTYGEIYSKLQPGASITVCFTASGAVEYLYVESYGAVDSLKSGTMAAKDPVSGNPFAQLTAGTTDYRVVKNGAAATMSDVRRYDVATFDAKAKVLYVSDFRVSCVYQGASPSVAAPSKITTSLFKQELDVLDCAIDDLKHFKFGDSFTLLFTSDGKVAGAVKTSEARSNVVGYVEKGDLKLLNAPVHLPEVSSDGFSFDKYLDCLVSVTGTKSGVSLSRLSGKSNTGVLDVKARKLGDTPLADNLAVFDRIANSGIKQVSLSDIAVASVPAAQIAYWRTNAAGKIDLLVLDNVTGDLYTYGIVSTRQEETDSFDGKPIYNTVITVKNGRGERTETIGGVTYKDGQFIAMAASLNRFSATSFYRPAASIALKSVEKVTPNNFNFNTGLFFSGSIELPIWDGVQCYNTQTKDWFRLAKETENETDEENTMRVLESCLAYSSNLTVYYDRDPAQGGKVRIVVAN